MFLPGLLLNRLLQTMYTSALLRPLLRHRPAMPMLASFVVASALLISVAATDGGQDRPVSVTVVVCNQRQVMHEQRALRLQRALLRDAKGLPHLALDVEVGSLSFPHLAYWTFTPLLEQFKDTKADWMVVVDEFVSVDLNNLLDLLLQMRESSFIGRSLRDTEASAIHHYRNPKEIPPYFDPRAGLILSGDLVRRVGISANATDGPVFQFVIDPAYEFTSWLLTVAGASLDGSDRLCVQASDERRGGAERCAIVAHDPYICEAAPEASAKSIGLHVAVKTFSGHHSSRLSVMRDTWLPQAPSRTLFSDVTDRVQGTVSCGVANTKRGHCAKTIAILKLALEEAQPWQWLLVADDDTLLSVPRLSSVLSCYSALEPLALGEVYGYRPLPHLLVPYPTGGSGMVFSRPMVTAMTSSSWCECQSADAPDDMLLGMCLHRLGHSIVHVRDMHQNTPPSYSEGRLYGTRPISFHGFWMIDPVQEFQRWLRDSSTKDGKPFVLLREGAVEQGSPSDAQVDHNDTAAHDEL